MEPDLDRLLDFESHGGLFPQFGEKWDRAFEAATRLALRSRRADGTRARVAIGTAEPLSFCSLFLAFAREPMDLFFFNPTWGRSEFDTAARIAKIDLLIGDFSDPDFKYNQSSQAPVSEAVSMGVNKLRVMIPTGGSSGQIRFAVHNWSTLAAATYGFVAHLNCERMTAHCVLPLYHVSGFMQLIRALLTMGRLVFGNVDTFAERHQLLCETVKGSLFLSLVSTQLQRLIQDEQNHARLRHYDAIFLGGGPCPIGLLEKCRELKIPLAPTYGMTESAAQVATLLPAAFFAGQTSQGKTLPHVRIDIVNEEQLGEVLPVGKVGRIRIFGMSLFCGYAGEKPRDDSAPVVTSDLGCFDEARNLSVLGRADRVVLSGGEKVNLREVEVTLERSGLVEDVVAFGREDFEWGEKLAVAYVPKDVVVTESALKAYVDGELANHKVPKVWIRMKEIPRNAAGKPIVSELRLS